MQSGFVVFCEWCVARVAANYYSVLLIIQVLLICMLPDVMPKQKDTVHCFKELAV